MMYYTIQPGERLRDFISHFWVGKFDGAQQEPFTYYSTADSCAKLVFFSHTPAGKSSLSDPEFFSSGLQGQTQTHGQYPTSGGFEIFGVNLLPYAIPHLFAIPAPELNNQILSLDLLLGQEGKDLNEQMMLAADTHQRVQIITRFFENQLRRHYARESIITSAIQEVRAKNGLVDLHELANQCFWSQKQFERKFKEWSGFTPKLYARIVRFEAVLNTYTHYRSLTEIGYACGYYDQSHFIRDFKEFTGFSPSQYFALV